MKNLINNNSWEQAQLFEDASEEFNSQDEELVTEMSQKITERFESQENYEQWEDDQTYRVTSYRPESHLMGKSKSYMQPLGSL